MLSLEYELGYADAKALIEAGRPNMVDTVRENVLDESQARLPIRRKIR